MTGFKSNFSDPHTHSLLVDKLVGDAYPKVAVVAGSIDAINALLTLASKVSELETRIMDLERKVL